MPPALQTTGSVQMESIPTKSAAGLPHLSPPNSQQPKGILWPKQESSVSCEVALRANLSGRPGDEGSTGGRGLGLPKGVEQAVRRQPGGKLAVGPQPGAHAQCSNLIQGLRTHTHLNIKSLRHPYLAPLAGSWCTRKLLNHAHSKPECS